MGRLVKNVFAAAASAALLLSAGAAWAGPTVQVAVNNNWTVVANNNPRDCLATVLPAFGSIASGGSQTYGTTGQGSATTIYVCEVQWAKATSSSDYCRFRISRTRTVNSSGGYWNAPAVIVTKGSGVNCTYTIGGNALDPAGNFGVTLNLAN